MLPGLLAGVAFGLGAYLVVRGLFPAQPPLARALADLERSPIATSAIESAGALGRVERGLGRWASGFLEGFGADLGGARPDLRLVGRTPEKHAFDKLLVAWVFVSLPVVTGLVAAAGGARPPWVLTGGAALILGAAGFFVPDLTLRGEAEQRRREFRHALSSYVDLVVIVLAGGGGTETALHEAAEVGQGWTYAELRQALAAARLAGESPWSVLERLGVDLGVTELSELAAGIRLAGEHGARVRASLSAKAESLREHRLAEAEAEAQSATERMALPVVLMLFGFLLFVLYPALTHVLTGL